MLKPEHVINYNNYDVDNYVDDEVDDDDNDVDDDDNDLDDNDIDDDLSPAGVLRHPELHRLDQHNLLCQVGASKAAPCFFLSA